MVTETTISLTWLKRSLKLDVQGQGGGWILDVDGQGGWGVLKIAQSPLTNTLILKFL